MTSLDDIPILPIKLPADYVVYNDIYTPEKKAVFPPSFFDEAKLAWRSNKIKPDKKYWRYGCIHIRTNGKLCLRPLHTKNRNEGVMNSILKRKNKSIIEYPYCKYHYNKYKWASLDFPERSSSETE